MSSQVSRHFYAIAAVTLVFSAGISRPAAAKQCTADSDCDAGYQCSLAPTRGGTSGVGGTTGSTTPGSAGPELDSSVPVPTDGGVATKAPVADAGPPTTPSTGTCEPKPIVCASTADCQADFECVKDWIAVTQPACPADTKCATPPPQTSDTGTCQAVPRACSSSADCPAPLVCQSQGATCSASGSVGPDGVVTTTEETCTQGKSVCTYVPTTCTADSGCADSYQCVTVSEGQRCSGSSGMCNRSVDGGSVSCSTPEPPVCTSFVVMNCLPKQIACGAGQACPSGWRCFDYSNLDGTVPGWIADESRKSCMPDGLILAVEGHAAGGGAGGATGGSESAGVLGGDKGAVATTLRGDAGLTGDTSAAGGTQEGTGTTAVKANGGGCTLGGGHPASSSLWLALALAGLVVCITRRRSAARQ